MVLLKPGVTCKEIYTSAVAYIEAKRPDLKDNFLKNCGFAVSRLSLSLCVFIQTNMYFGIFRLELNLENQALFSAQSVTVRSLKAWC